MSDLISDPRTHELKTWAIYFCHMESGRKTFEYRKDDREPRFAVGDVLRLREVDDYGLNEQYTGRECFRRVTYVARGGPIIPEGFCIMSMEPVAPSVSSSAPPPTWDEMASMFPDNTKRANRPRGSSAEPAPPTDDARKLGLIEFALKAHRFVEAEDFDDGHAAGEIAAHCSCGFICSPEGNEWMKDHRIAWERHVAAAILAAKPSYSVVMDAEKSSLSPVQEEASRNKKIRELTPIVEKWARDMANLCEPTTPDVGWGIYYDWLNAFLSAALPKITEIATDRDEWMGRSAFHQDRRDEEHAKVANLSSRIAQLETDLRGSISERERLTAQNEATQKRCDEIKAALEAARHALTVSHGLTATDKPQAYEDSILHDGCDALQARDVQREVSWEIDNSKEIAMIDAVLPFTPQCPDCKSVLSRIVRPEGNTLSDEAFSREYGDWRCDTCPPNNATWHPYRVFWNARTEPHD